MGSPRRVGRVVEADIYAEVTKQRKKSGPVDGVNFHLHATDVEKVKNVIGLMEPLLTAYFAYAENCPNVSLLKTHFVSMYLEASALPTE